MDNLFGKGDHAELLELDDLPMEETLSPIKPITSFDEQNYVSVTISGQVENDSGENVAITNDDVKANLFDAHVGNTEEEEKTMTFDVDIETAPSDELMADQIVPMSLDTTAVKDDIGQL